MFCDNTLVSVFNSSINVKRKWKRNLNKQEKYESNAETLKENHKKLDSYSNVETFDEKMCWKKMLGNYKYKNIS